MNKQDLILKYRLLGKNIVEIMGSLWDFGDNYTEDSEYLGAFKCNVYRLDRGNGLKIYFENKNKEMEKVEYNTSVVYYCEDLGVVDINECGCYLFGGKYYSGNKRNKDKDGTLNIRDIIRDIILRGDSLCGDVKDVKIVSIKDGSNTVGGFKSLFKEIIVYAIVDGAFGDISGEFFVDSKNNIYMTIGASIENEYWCSDSGDEVELEDAIFLGDGDLEDVDGGKRYVENIWWVDENEVSGDLRVFLYEDEIKKKKEEEKWNFGSKGYEFIGIN